MFYTFCQEAEELQSLKRLKINTMLIILTFA